MLSVFESEKSDMDQFDLQDAYNNQKKLKKIYDDASPVITGLSERLNLE